MGAQQVHLDKSVRCVYQGHRKGGRGGRGVCPLPVFGRSVNPVLIRGVDYAHQIATAPPRFLDLLPPLHSIPGAPQYAHAVALVQDRPPTTLKTYILGPIGYYLHTYEYYTIFSKSRTLHFWAFYAREKYIFASFIAKMNIHYSSSIFC